MTGDMTGEVNFRKRVWGTIVAMLDCSHPKLQLSVKKNTECNFWT